MLVFANMCPVSRGSTALAQGPEPPCSEDLALTAWVASSFCWMLLFLFFSGFFSSESPKKYGLNICHILWLIHMNCWKMSSGLGMGTSFLKFGKGNITHGFNLSCQEMKSWINEDQNRASKRGSIFIKTTEHLAEAILTRFWRHDSVSFIIFNS